MYEIDGGQFTAKFKLAAYQTNEVTIWKAIAVLSDKTSFH